MLFGRAASGSFAALASGYPLHHPRRYFHGVPSALVGSGAGGFASIPLAMRPSGANEE